MMFPWEETFVKSVIDYFDCTVLECEPVEEGNDAKAQLATLGLGDFRGRGPLYYFVFIYCGSCRYGYDIVDIFLWIYLFGIFINNGGI